MCRAQLLFHCNSSKCEVNLDKKKVEPFIRLLTYNVGLRLSLTQIRVELLHLSYTAKITIQPSERHSL